MTDETLSSILVVADDSVEFPSALRYAASAARCAGARVMFLCVIEPEGIEPWGGVARAMDDEAFDDARGKMMAFEEQALALSGQKPLTLYKKGERAATLLATLAEHPEITALVLATGIKAGSNPLIHHLTTDKGLRKLAIPLIIVPEKVG